MIKWSLAGWFKLDKGEREEEAGGEGEPTRGHS